MTNAEKYKQEIKEIVKPNEQAETVLAYNIKTNKKVKQLLFVEDGSADMFNLYSQLSGNPEIAIIVYRKNSRTPVLANLEDEK